ncbi:MAG: hypothetical protein ABJH28_02745 [Paraglaciecola sp.]|uniref:hypothetical protein n=1 Tax=Paraglaciecola sp. TaxID=1920173 RepID=UPI00326318E5
MLYLHNKKVIIITDSLGLPRSTPEPVTDDQTWVYKIMDYFGKDYRFRLFRHRGMDTTSLVHHLNNNLSVYKDIDIVIMQVGIVDCYPRALSRKNLLKVKAMPNWVQNLIHRMINKYYKFFVELSDNRYVTPTKFSQNLDSIKNYFKSSKVFVIPIAPANVVYRDKNSKIENSIKEYNELHLQTFENRFLKETYCSMDAESIVLSDGHHLSVLGHQEVYLSVKKLLSKAILSPK